MAYCSKCGSQLSDTAQFCTSCGTSIHPSQAQNQQQPNQQYQQGNQFQQNGYSNQQNTQCQQNTQYQQNASMNQQQYQQNSHYNQAQDITENKAMGILSYIGFLVLIPLFTAKNSKFSRFHANQGLIIFIGEVAYFIIARVIQSIAFSLSWRFGALVSSLVGLVGLVFLAYSILGIINASQGQFKELPFIGKIKILH